jgi:ribosomal protein S12 methylthiotransferase accessory factor
MVHPMAESLLCSRGVGAATRDRFAAALAEFGGSQSVTGSATLLVHHSDWAGERALLADASPQGRSYVRIGFDGDRLWIGPRFGGGTSGCSICFEARLRSNHPRGEEWADLFARAEPGQSGEFPLAPGLAGVAAALTVEIAGHAAEGTLPYFVFNCGTLRSERHGFFPDPECPACGALPEDSAQAARLALASRPKQDRRRYRLDNPALTKASLDRAFVDRRSGLVKHVFQDMNSHLMPMAAAEAVMMRRGGPTMGYGRAPTVEQSRMVAVLETAERFASIRPRGRRTAMRASRAALGDRAVDPELFTLHAPAQAAEPGYELGPYSDALEQGWTFAHSVRRGEAVLMPEQIAYYGLADRPGEPASRYVHETSSGCALGGSIEEATLYGLFELLERDAYMTGWYGEFHFPRLDCSGADDPSIAALIERSRAEGYELHLFDMTLEFGVPSIWAMIEDPRDDAPVRSYCASAAHIDPEKAIAAALVEVVTSMAVYRKSMPPQRERARQLLAEPSLVQGMEDHVLVYSQPETMAWLSFLPRFEAGIPIRERFSGWYERAPPADLRIELDAILERVLAVAHDVLIVDQSFSALDQIGLKAVRVSAPGLSPIAFGHQYRRVAVDRINKAARFLGVDRRFTAGTVNLNPHNFP